MDGLSMKNIHILDADLQMNVEKSHNFDLQRVRLLRTNILFCPPHV